MIIVGYLATKEGRQGITGAIEEAARRKSALTVVVSEKATVTPPDVLAEREVELQGIAQSAKDRGIECEIRVLAERHDVAEDLIAVAEETKADLIVIGLRRRSPVGKLILGSNAQRILLDAPCPVLAVKTERVR